jgi:hypothetical protein
MRSFAGKGDAMQKARRFKPNQLTLADCRVRIERALKKIRFDTGREIFTSRDKAARALTNLLKTTNVPQGFVKWQLPVWLDMSMMFISVAPPNVSVPEHSHDGPGIRFIASGSIGYKGTQLTAGDWMFIPAGKKYTFEVGPLGASMFYCYQC